MAWLYSIVLAFFDALFKWAAARSATPTTAEDSKPDADLEKRLQDEIQRTIDENTSRDPRND